MKNYLGYLLGSMILTGCVSNPNNTETTSQLRFVRDLDILPKIETVDSAEIEAIIKQDISSPLFFYGQVVDEDGLPLPNVKIDAVMLNRSLEPLEPPYYGWTFLTNIISDEKGRFKITNTQGAAISIKANKDGYWDNVSLERHFYYSPRLADLNTFDLPLSEENPSIFVLQKKPEEAYFTKVSTGSILLKENEVIGIDLLGPRYPTSTEESDFNLILHRDMQSKEAAGTWFIELNINEQGGGFQHVTGSLDFQAPESGYSNTIKLEPQRSLRFSGERAEWNLYVKTTKNHYALITLKARMLDKPFISIEGSLNTSGARYVR